MESMMVLKKWILSILWIGALGIFANAATITARSTSYSDVSAAISSASPGDTVVVPSGSSTWNTTLTITKGITLKGSGIDQTRISSGMGINSFLIIYRPFNPEKDEVFRLTGFTFDGSQNSTCVEVLNPSDNDHIHNIRIDHNKFYHCGYGTVSGAGVVFGNLDGGGSGRISGVIDNNTFTDCTTFTRAYGSYTASWEQDPPDLGGPTGMYVENNIMTMSSAWASSHPASLHHASSGWGGRYVYRFNNISYENGGWQDGFDVHGRQISPGHRGSVTIELYENTIHYGASSRFVHWRGGTGIIHNNSLSNALIPQLTCEIYSRWPGDSAACTEWPCPDMLNGYIFDNFNNGSLQKGVTFTKDTDTEILHENRDYWLHKTPFNGTSGVGSGPVAERPATCTPGVGYWATDQGEWNSEHNGNDGQLYRCTAAGTWEMYYKPYSYPHPLSKGTLYSSDQNRSTESKIVNPPLNLVIQ